MIPSVSVIDSLGLSLQMHLCVCGRMSVWASVCLCVQVPKVAPLLWSPSSFRLFFFPSVSLCPSLCLFLQILYPIWFPSLSIIHCFLLFEFQSQLGLFCMVAKWFLEVLSFHTYGNTMEVSLPQQSKQTPNPDSGWPRLCHAPSGGPHWCSGHSESQASPWDSIPSE